MIPRGNKNIAQSIPKHVKSACKVPVWIKRVVTLEKKSTMKTDVSLTLQTGQNPRIRTDDGSESDPWE